LYREQPQVENKKESKIKRVSSTGLRKTLTKPNRLSAGGRQLEVLAQKKWKKIALVTFLALIVASATTMEWVVLSINKDVVNANNI
jgi:hypothetical protein